MKRPNPFLSEFRGWPRKILTLPSYRWKLVLIPPLLAFATLAWGYFAGNDALELAFQLTFKDGVVHNELRVNHLFGYLGEVNHAALYIFVAPLIIYLGLVWIEAASNCVDELTRGGTLIDVYGKSPVAILSTYNRRRFGGVLDFFCLRKFRILFYNFFFVLIVVLTFKTLVTEIQPSPPKSPSPLVTWDNIGYTFSSSLSKWVADFNQLPHVDQLKLLNDDKKFGPELEASLRSYVKLHPWLIRQAPGLITFDDPNLSITGSIGDINDALNRDTYQTNLLDALNNHVIFLEAKQRGASPVIPKFARITTNLSLLTGWLNESVFQAFLVWLVLKMIFFLVFLSLLLPGNSRLRLRLKPNYVDPNLRYGFFPLFRVYNLTVLLIAVGGFMFNLMALNTIELKLNHDTIGLNSFYGKLLALAGIVALMSLLIGGPVILFRLKLFKFQERRRQRLALNDPKQTTIEKQLTWPKDDKTFLLMLSCVLAFVLLPFGIHLTQLKEAEAWVSVPHWLYSMAQALTNSFLH